MTEGNGKRTAKDINRFGEKLKTARKKLCEAECLWP